MKHPWFFFCFLFSSYSRSFHFPFACPPALFSLRPSLPLPRPNLPPFPLTTPHAISILRPCPSPSTPTAATLRGRRPRPSPTHPRTRRRLLCKTTARAAPYTGGGASRPCSALVCSLSCAEGSPDALAAPPSAPSGIRGGRALSLWLAGPWARLGDGRASAGGAGRR